jgi:hypothetical protein
MEIRNTSHYDSGEITRLVQFALVDVTQAGLDARSIAIVVKNNFKNPYNGLAYKGVPALSPWKKRANILNLITIRIGSPEWFPYHNYDCHKKMNYGGKKSPFILMDDWRQAVIAVAAHEGWHIMQFRMKWPAAEWQCEVGAHMALMRWRRQHGLGPMPRRVGD